MSNIVSIVMLSAFIFLSHKPIFAWGPIGHRVVGEVAHSYLTPKAEKAVKHLLDTESIAMAANWADFVKSDTSYDYLKKWHYVNLPEHLDRSSVFTFLDTAKGVNVYTQINAMTLLLKDDSRSKEEKTLALKMLIHMVGDLHQPLHTGRSEDWGGHKITLCWFGEKSDLHKIWDERLVDFQQLSYTEYSYTINHPTLKQLDEWKQVDLKELVFESYQICNKIYSTGIKTEDSLSYNYNYEWITTVNQQLLKGGVRLAFILNNIYR